MFNHQSSNPNGPRPASCPLPQVADAPQREDEPAEESYAGTDLATFKVFLKRNLRPQSPPADLISGIRARIEAISAAK